MNEIERSVWELHDKRLNDHETRFNAATQDFTEIKDALKQLTDRINEGVAKTQNKILDKHGQLEIAVNDLAHSVELNSEKLNTKINNVEFGLVERIKPLEKATERKDAIWWQMLIVVITVCGTFFGVRMLDRLWPEDRPAATVPVEKLKAAKVSH